MYTYILQDWISPRVDETQASLIQSEADWLSFQPYQDIIFYVEIKAADTGEATNLELVFETSPSKDESMFKAMTSVAFVGNVGTTQIAKVILSQNPDVPLARWVRWRFQPHDAPVSDWGATFRVLCAANAVGPLG